MNAEEKSTTKRTGAKVLACLLAVLLMVGIAFLVATLVHKNSAQPVSNIKNGLSAYELAVANGYVRQRGRMAHILEGQVRL